MGKFLIKSFLFILMASALPVSAEEALGIKCYQTNFGQIQFVFVPPKVVGIYAYGGGGVIVGDLQGNKLTASWAEPLATNYPTAGDAVFEFSSDWSGFNGRYKFAKSETWVDWNGQETNCQGAQRVQPQPYSHSH